MSKFTIKQAYLFTIKHFNTVTLSDIVRMVKHPTSVAKESAQWFIPSKLLSRSATEQCQKWRVIIPLAIPANTTDWQHITAIINDKFEQADTVFL